MLAITYIKYNVWIKHFYTLCVVDPMWKQFYVPLHFSSCTICKQETTNAFFILTVTFINAFSCNTKWNLQNIFDRWIICLFFTVTSGIKGYTSWVAAKKFFAERQYRHWQVLWHITVTWNVWLFNHNKLISNVHLQLILICIAFLYFRSNFAEFEEVELLRDQGVFH